MKNRFNEAKGFYINSNPAKSQSQNDGTVGNLPIKLKKKKDDTALRLKKNITCAEDQTNYQDPTFIVLCIKELQKQLAEKERSYSKYISILKDKISQKQIEGKNLNDELRFLRRQMTHMKQEMTELCTRMMKKAAINSNESPYELQQPPSTTKKVRKNKSSEYTLFKNHSRSKSKKDRYRKF